MDEIEPGTAGVGNQVEDGHMWIERAVQLRIRGPAIIHVFDAHARSLERFMLEIIARAVAGDVCGAAKLFDDLEHARTPSTADSQLRRPHEAPTLRKLEIREHRLEA